MGRERSRARQYLYLCVAGLTVIVLAACAPIRTILDEREGRAHLQQVRLLSRQGDFKGAVRENRKVLTRSPKNPPADAALFGLGLVYADRANPERDYKMALGFFNQLVKDFPYSPFAEDAAMWAGILENEVTAEREGQAHLKRMQLLTRKGDFEGALKENRKLLDPSAKDKDPLADAALFSLGLIYADYVNPEKDYRQALGFFTRLVKEFPQSPFAEEGRIWVGLLENWIVGQEGRAHLERMQVLVSQGDFEGALQEDQKVLALSPKSLPADAALFSMGLIHAHFANPKRDNKKALGYFMQLVKEFPQSPLAEGARIWAGALGNEVMEGRAHLQRVQLFIRKGDFEGALRENQRVLALYPRSAPGDAALFSMGLIHVHFANPKMDYKKGLGFFQRLKKEFPNSPFAEEAKAWIGVLETMEKSLKVDMEIEEKKKELRR